MNPDEQGQGPGQDIVAQELAAMRAKQLAPADDIVAQELAKIRGGSGTDEFAGLTARMGKALQKPSDTEPMPGVKPGPINNDSFRKRIIRDVALPAARMSEVLGTGMPGMNLAQSGVRSLMTGQPMAESIDALNADKANTKAGLAAGANAAGLPGADKLLSVPGAVVSQMALPGGNVLAGGLYGLLSGGLKNANLSGTGRAWEAGKDAVLGAGAGKVADLAGPALQAKFGTPTLPANLLKRSADRTAAADPLYEKFRQLGDLGRTPELDQILELPLVRDAMRNVKGTNPDLVNLPNTDAAVLASTYTKVGDKAWAAKMGHNPGRAVEELGKAIESAAQAKGGSFMDAVGAFREGSNGISAVKRGAQTLANASAPKGTPLQNATTRSPEALEQWSTNPLTSTAEKEGAAEGILGRLKSDNLLTRLPLTRGIVPLPFPSKALRQAGPLLNQVQDKGTLQQILERLAAGNAGQP